MSSTLWEKIAQIKQYLYIVVLSHLFYFLNQLDLGCLYSINVIPINILTEAL